MCEFGLCGWLRVVISPESYNLWTWDLHHWIQQRLRFVSACGSIPTTPSDLEQWAPRLNQYAWIWFTWVNSCCHISWTLQPMDMRLAPLDTTKMEVYKDMWKYCDHPISFGAMSSWNQLCFMNFVYVVEFVWPCIIISSAPYTTYGHETCTTGRSKYSAIQCIYVEWYLYKMESCMEI